MEVTNKIFITPYSQHYLCTYELFGDNTLGLVFQYLFDNYLKSCRLGKSEDGFELIISNISRNLVMGRNTIYKYLSKLEEIGVIQLDQKICTVNADYFCSVAKLYSFAKQQIRKEISQAFILNDIKKLEEFGLDTEVNLEEEVRNLSSGWIVSNETVGVPNRTQGVSNETPTVSNRTPIVPNDTVGVSNGTPTVSNDTNLLSKIIHAVSGLQDNDGKPLFDPKQVYQMEQLVYQMEQQGVSNGTTEINNIINNKKENAGEALKRMEDDYLEKGASSQKFLENSSEAEDDYELPAYTTQKEFLRKMSRDRNEAKFQEYIRGRHPEKYELLPVHEIQEIIQNPENHKQDWEQVIYLLWQTTGDDEGEATLSCESEITAEFLMKVVMNVKDDMEESGQGFTLSLEQIFDMLAFDVAPEKNYTTFQLDFSKIRDLRNPVQDDVERVEDEEENGPGRTPRRSRLEERRRIMAYLDSITETADSRGVDSLTAAEYAILQMIDYVEERRQNRETNPDEVTVYCMGELSKKWAWEADMPDEEIGELFRTLPKRGNRITLHPERIPVDKILQMNEKRKEHSCVEELWEKKQSEEHEED